MAVIPACASQAGRTSYIPDRKEKMVSSYDSYGNTSRKLRQKENRKVLLPFSLDAPSAHTLSPVFLLTLPFPNFILLPYKRKILDGGSRLGHEIPKPPCRESYKSKVRPGAFADMEASVERDQCKKQVGAIREYRQEIPSLVQELVRTCYQEDSFSHISPEPLPSLDSTIDIIERARRILFPGYFIRSRVDDLNLEYYLGEEETSFFQVLSEQITLCIRHECLRYHQPCTHCEERGQETAIEFLKEMPRLRSMLSKDVRAALEGDPATQSTDEIIFSYPGLFAITVYRLAHQLFDLGIPLMPRMMTEYAHSKTGIDIHPGARIGESFFIDHGTGVVIGETTFIGNRVRLYQGVTLGALSVPRGATEKLREQKRHPTIEDDVIIYSGATILGGDTLIGARSVIGGNVWITESIPQDMHVFLKRPELVFRGKSTDHDSRKKMKED